MVNRVRTSELLKQRKPLPSLRKIYKRILDFESDIGSLQKEEDSHFADVLKTINGSNGENGRQYKK